MCVSLSPCLSIRLTLSLFLYQILELLQFSKVIASCGCKVANIKALDSPRPTPKTLVTVL